MDGGRRERDGVGCRVLSERGMPAVSNAVGYWRSGVSRAPSPVPFAAPRRVPAICGVERNSPLKREDATTRCAPAWPGSAPKTFAFLTQSTEPHHPADHALATWPVDGLCCSGFAPWSIRCMASRVTLILALSRRLCAVLRDLHRRSRRRRLLLGPGGPPSATNLSSQVALSRVRRH